MTKSSIQALELEPVGCGVELPKPFKKSGQQMSYDGVDKVFFDCYTNSQLIDYGNRRAAEMLRTQATEIDRLKLMLRMHENISSVANGKDVAEMLKERDQLKAKNEKLIAWLGSNMTFYDVDSRCHTQHPNIPVLASVSKRIWYHATDNQLDYPFSQVVMSALKENT